MTTAAASKPTTKSYTLKLTAEGYLTVSDIPLTAMMLHDSKNDRVQIVMPNQDVIFSRGGVTSVLAQGITTAKTRLAEFPEDLRELPDWG
jgi:hypothetical protein